MSILLDVCFFIFIFVSSLILLISIVAGQYLAKFHVNWLPESGAFILIGLIISAFLKIFNQNELISLTAFNPEIFFFLLLPPIIFEAGVSLKKVCFSVFMLRNFFKNFNTIIVMAVGGTIFATMFIGMITFYLLDFNLFDAFLFGVATISIFQQLHVVPHLYSLVFCESVLNDAVAIVLYRSLSRSQITGHEDLPSVIIEFLWIGLSSVVLGFLSGLIASFLLKHATIEKRGPQDSAIVLLVAYITYLFGEHFHLSGVVSIFFVGITVSHYGEKTISEENHECVHFVIHTISHFCETVVFVLLGLSTFAHIDKYPVLLGFQASIIVVCSRFLTVFIFIPLINMGRKIAIPRKMQVVTFFSGLRGAIAFALALNLPSTTEQKNDIIAMTHFTILLTVFVFGGSTSALLQKLGNLTEDSENPMSLECLSKKGKKNINRLKIDNWFQKYFGVVKALPSDQPTCPPADYQPAEGVTSYIQADGGGLIVPSGSDNDESLPSTPTEVVLDQEAIDSKVNQL